jgi:hypothetical protein
VSPTVGVAGWAQIHLKKPLVQWVPSPSCFTLVNIRSPTRPISLLGSSPTHPDSDASCSRCFLVVLRVLRLPQGDCWSRLQPCNPGIRSADSEGSSRHGGMHQVIGNPHHGPYARYAKISTYTYPDESCLPSKRRPVLTDG